MICEDIKNADNALLGDKNNQYQRSFSMFVILLVNDNMVS